MKILISATKNPNSPWAVGWEKSDIAGEVVALGPGVDGFEKGDLVAGLAVGHSTKREGEKAFQSYTILQTNIVYKIPDAIQFENAALLRLGLYAASNTLFNPEFLNLQLPTKPVQKPTGKTLLVQ